MSRRAVQLSNVIRSELTELIGRRVKDPRLEGLITITGVEMSEDLKHARVFFCLMGAEGDSGRRGEVQRGLASSAGFLKCELGRRIRLKFPPELSFSYDDSFDYATRIERVLRDLRENEEGPGEGGEDP
ncbi:MAG: 30S ribosome-binding factor RbfA [Pseudomonadota bacterium]